MKLAVPFLLVLFLATTAVSDAKKKIGSAGKVVGWA